MQKISTVWPYLAPFWPYLAPFGQCGPCAHVFTSWARVREQIFTKFFVWVFYYHISLSFKFHTDPSFCCGDIFSDTRYFKVPIHQGEYRSFSTSSASSYFFGNHFSEERMDMIFIFLKPQAIWFIQWGSLASDCPVTHAQPFPSPYPCYCLSQITRDRRR